MSLDDLTQALVKCAKRCPCCGEPIVSGLLYAEDLGFEIYLGCRSSVVSTSLIEEYDLSNIPKQELSLLFDELSFQHVNEHT